MHNAHTSCMLWFVTLTYRIHEAGTLITSCQTFFADFPYIIWRIFFITINLYVNIEQMKTLISFHALQDYQVRNIFINIIVYYIIQCSTFQSNQYNMYIYIYIYIIFLCRICSMYLHYECPVFKRRFSLFLTLFTRISWFQFVGIEVSNNVSVLIERSFMFFSVYHSFSKIVS